MEQQLIQQAWFESPSTRLNRWRQFRNGLNTDIVIDVCETVIDWWKMAPISSMTIDPVESSTWPTPWEMLHSGNFCENSLALGMSYTIYYANEDIPNELLYVTDRQNSIQRLCVMINNKYLLNYSYGAISTLPTKNVSISFRKNIADVIKN
ncbi:MAG: hypothetical protein CMQ75_05090 [Gammaproteobacteria bacterium]|nr:hypothetical protein [Gammaproteobacteria bacterium]